MMLAALLRRLRIKRELDRSLRERRAARQARADAARRGQSTYWQRAGDRHRELFPR